MLSTPRELEAEPNRLRPSLLCILALLTGGLLLAGPSSAAPKKAKPPAIEPDNPESAVAEQGTIYVLVDQRAMIAQIKIRGITLELLPLKFFAFLDYRKPSEIASPGRKVQLPALFTVQEDATAVYRKYIAPEELISVREAEKLEAEREAAAKAAAEAAKERGETPPPPKKKEVPTEPEPPSEYRIQLDEGWSLEVTTEAPDLSLKGQLEEAFHDGFARLQGEEVETPRLLGLTLSPDDARRLHRLLRPGLQILVIG